MVWSEVIKLAINSTVSDCSNDSTIYISTEKEAGEILFSPTEVVFMNFSCGVL